MSAKKQRIGKWQWIEEYRCGCSEDFDRRSDAIGYCPTHGENRRYLHKIPRPGGKADKILKSYDELDASKQERRVSMSEWISLSDGLPEWEVETETFKISDTVLVFSSGGMYHVAYLEIRDKYGIARWVKSDGEDFPYIPEVTHWQPLPAPPTKEE